MPSDRKRGGALGAHIVLLNKPLRIPAVGRFKGLAHIARHQHAVSLRTDENRIFVPGDGVRLHVLDDRIECGIKHTVPVEDEQSFADPDGRSLIKHRSRKGTVSRSEKRDRNIQHRQFVDFVVFFFFLRQRDVHSLHGRKNIRIRVVVPLGVQVRHAALIKLKGFRLRRSFLTVVFFR